MELVAEDTLRSVACVVNHIMWCCHTANLSIPISIVTGVSEADTCTAEMSQETSVRRISESEMWFQKEWEKYTFKFGTSTKLNNLLYLNSPSCQWQAAYFRHRVADSLKTDHSTGQAGLSLCCTICDTCNLHCLCALHVNQRGCCDGDMHCFEHFPQHV